MTAPWSWSSSQRATNEPPTSCNQIRRLTPFAAMLRYQDEEESHELDPTRAEILVQQLRVWVEAELKAVQ